MLVSWNILKTLVRCSSDVASVCERLTETGSEVESVSRPGEKLSNIRVARIREIEVHPTKSSLFVATLDLGGTEAQCVTAATNLSRGDVIAYAAPGASIFDGTVMGVRDFDGVESRGMMLSAEELGIPEVGLEFGILRLPGDAPVGGDAVSYLGLDDAILDLSITPNRGDLLSHIGVAREIYALFDDAIFTAPRIEQREKSGEWPIPFKGVSIEDDGCPGYSLGLIRDVRIAPSPIDIRVALTLLGLRPISNIVDATNYCMLLLGQPQHAFDLDTLRDREITVRAARDSERIMTLDGRMRTLTPSDLLITSGGVAIGVAGVMGGGDTEISDRTKNVALECASFVSQRVSTTSRRLGIRSEAAYRYARGVDPELADPAISFTLSLVESWNAGNACPVIVRADSGKRIPRKVRLTKEKMWTILHWNDLGETARILGRLGIRRFESGGENDTYEIPSYRADISIQEDLVEEVARIRGYNDMPSRLPQTFHERGDAGAITKMRFDLRSFAIGRGYVEVVTYAFVSPESLARLRFVPGDARGNPMKLANPISSDQSAMRTTLLPGLMNALSKSISSGWRDPVRIFEQGRVFLGEGAAMEERERFAGLVFPGRDFRSPYGSGENEDFFTVKGDVAALLSSRGREAEFRQGSEPFGHAGQTADIILDGERIGYLARLKPAIERELDFGAPVYAFEFECAPLVEKRRISYSEIPAYPSVYRDVSVLVPCTESVAAVTEGIRESAGALLRDLRLFDVYHGKGIPEGVRSLAFSLSYRDAAKTLTEGEVDCVNDRVRADLEKKGYILR